MKLKNLSNAVALACLAISSQSAFALDASVWASGNSTDIYVSGASAQDSGVLTFALQQCTAGTLHRYAISNNFVYFCTASNVQSSGGLPNFTNTQLAVYKFSVGGSGNGVAPVNNGAALPFLDLSKIASSCAAVASNITTSATFGTFSATYVNTVCGASSNTLTTAVTTKIGLSDVEPAFFAADADISGLTSEALSTLIFGVPVSRNIYKALQTQQGLNVGDCTNTASSTSAPVWEYSNQCMPSLTRHQIVHALTRRSAKWADIGVTSGLANDTIYVARRVNSSGTQKTFEALIAEAPNGEPYKSCNTDTNLFVQPNSGNTGLTTGDAATACSAASGASLRVVAGLSGGGDVRNCLIAHNGNNRGAIGMLTAEDTASAATNWRFVKVDGVAPTQAGVAGGSYRYWTVPSLNYLAATNTGEYATFLARFKYEQRDASGITIQQPFGGSGLMALWTLQTGAPAKDFTGASGVNPWFRTVGGAVNNNCQAPRLAE